MGSIKLQTLTAALLLSACGADEAPTETAAPEPPLVQIAEVRAGDSNRLGRAVGTVRLRSEVALGFTSPGQIAAITVDDGDRVQKGQMLAALSRDTVAADLASARAEAERAARDLDRARNLFDQGWVTRARLDDSEAAAQAAQARVDAADFAVRTARIVAPSDGVILRRLAETGQVVDAGTPVLTLGRADEGFVLSVPLTDRQAAALNIGDTAMATIDALGGAPVQARLTELAGRADTETGTFAAEFSLVGLTGLRSGQIGTIRLPSPGEQTGVIVPPTALTNARAGEAVVWVYDPGTRAVSMRTVATEGISEDGAEILSGLRPGERVVTANLDALRDGARVRVP